MQEGVTHMLSWAAFIALAAKPMFLSTSVLVLAFSRASLWNSIVDNVPSICASCFSYLFLRFRACRAAAQQRTGKGWWDLCPQQPLTLCTKCHWAHRNIYHLLVFVVHSSQVNYAAQPLSQQDETFLTHHRQRPCYSKWKDSISKIIHQKHSCSSSPHHRKAALLVQLLPDEVFVLLQVPSSCWTPGRSSLLKSKEKHSLSFAFKCEIHILRTQVFMYVLCYSS